MAHLDREAMQKWNREQIIEEIYKRDRMIELLIKEEMEQSEAYSPLEVDAKQVVDYDEAEIKSLREEIRELAGML